MTKQQIIERVRQADGKNVEIGWRDLRGLAFWKGVERALPAGYSVRFYPQRFPREDGKHGCDVRAERTEIGALQQ